MLLPLHVHVLCHVCIANKVINAKINIGFRSVHYNMFLIHKIVERYSKNNFEPMFMKFLSLLICYRKSRHQYQHYNSDLSHKPVILIQPLPICTKYTSFSDCLVRCLSVLSVVIDPIQKTDVTGCLHNIYKSKIFKNRKSYCMIMCILTTVM